MGSRLGVKNGEGQVHKQPGQTSARSFSLPKLGGLEQVRDLVSDYGGIHLVSTDFKIGVDLVNRYLSGQLDAPYTFLVALYWHTAHGFRQGFAEAHWTHQYNSFKRKQAETQVKQLETVLEHAIALLEHRGDAAQLVRESLDLARLPPAERYSGDPLAGVGRLV